MKQLDLFDANKKKEQGMNISLLNAESRKEGWAKEAILILYGFLRVQGDTPFLGEEFRVWCEKYGLSEPPSKRAYGGVMVRAAKLGLIEKVGYAKTTNPLAHRTPANLWKRKNILT